MGMRAAYYLDTGRFLTTGMRALIFSWATGKKGILMTFLAHYIV